MSKEYYNPDNIGTYKTLRKNIGITYYVDKTLHQMLWQKGVDCFQMFEHKIEASARYPHIFAHTLTIISLLSGANQWWQLLICLMCGYILGSVLSLSCTFITYLVPLNSLMIFYNVLQKFFIFDILIFVLYIVKIELWWMIPIHIVISILVSKQNQTRTNKERLKIR